MRDGRHDSSVEQCGTQIGSVCSKAVRGRWHPAGVFALAVFSESHWRNASGTLHRVYRLSASQGRTLPACATKDRTRRRESPRLRRMKNPALASAGFSRSIPDSNYLLPIAINSFLFVMYKTLLATIGVLKTELPMSFSASMFISVECSNTRIAPTSLPM